MKLHGFKLSLLTLGLAIFTQVGCVVKNDSSNDLPMIPVSEAQIFDMGLKGAPAFVSSQYTGTVTVEMMIQGEMKTFPAGTMDVGFVVLGDYIDITLKKYAVGSPRADMDTKYSVSVFGNSLLKGGREVGQVGGYAMQIVDGSWTYKLLKARDATTMQNDVMKVTATAGTGDQMVKYTGVLKLK